LAALAAYPRQQRLAAEIAKMNRRQGEAEELAAKWNRRAETTEAAAEARASAEKYAAEAQELGRQMAAARRKLAGGNRSAALIWRQIRDNPEWQGMHSDAADIRELMELAVGDAAEAMLTELADWQRAWDGY
jgi:hypothetical protein